MAIDLLAEYINWLYSLSIYELLLIFLFPIVIDAPRTIGKAIALFLSEAKRRGKVKKHEQRIQPKISIIIPAHNEESGIFRTIQSIKENDYSNKEIIMIDDGSSDRTYQHASYSSGENVKLISRHTSGGFKASAVNLGLIYSASDMISVVDADTLLERSALREAMKYFDDPSVGAVSGNVRILSGDDGVTNLLTELQAYEYLIAFETGRRYNALINSLLIIPGAFGIFRRELAKSVGYFDRDTITEDFDLTIKLRKTGYKVRFAPDAIAWTFCPYKWKTWSRQRTRWAHGQMATLLKHRDVLQKHRYHGFFVSAMWDMLFMDMILLGTRVGWLATLALSFTPQLGFVLLSSVFLYMFLELINFLTAAALSSTKGDFKKIYLIPVMVLFYRPLYSFVRLKAYISFFMRKKTTW
jgi:cellulose synthase/poly-beta-1,6-N-acetylglucosamine synthase-like glycosyltransferase